MTDRVGVGSCHWVHVYLSSHGVAASSLRTCRQGLTLSVHATLVCQQDALHVFIPARRNCWTVTLQGWQNCSLTV
jgi:hypothetical protein